MVSPSFGPPNEYVHPRDLGIQLQESSGGHHFEGKLDADELLAAQIQEEENRRNRSATNSQHQGTVQRRQEHSSASNCIAM